MNQQRNNNNRSKDSKGSSIERDQIEEEGLDPSSSDDDNDFRRRPVPRRQQHQDSDSENSADGENMHGGTTIQSHDYQSSSIRGSLINEIGAKMSDTKRRRGTLRQTNNSSNMKRGSLSSGKPQGLQNLSGKFNAPKFGIPGHKSPESEQILERDLEESFRK